MKIEKIILNIVLSILNGLTFFIHPKQNRITFISMTADHLTGDFYQIDQALKKEGCYDIQYDLFQIHKTIKGYFLYKYMPEKDTVSMDGDPQLTHFNFVSNVDGQMDDKNNITSKEKEQKVKATMYVQETKGIVTTSLGMICKRSDGTVYLKNADGFMGCASVQDFGKGQSMTLNFSSDVGDKKISYEVEFKADRAVKKIQIIEMNKDDVKIKKTAYISPKIKQYQMQKDTAYVIINEQLIGMKGQTINRQKIHSAKKNFTYKWKQLGDDGVLTPTDLKFKK